MKALLSAGIILAVLSNIESAAVESLDQKYLRLQSELKSKEGTDSLELAVPVDPKSGPKTSDLFADYDAVIEPPVFDAIDPKLLPPKPERQVKTDFQKMLFSGTKFVADIVPNVPKSFFSYAPEIGEAVYITPVFDPKKHPPVTPYLYEAPVKTAKTDYSVYDLPFGANVNHV